MHAYISLYSSGGPQLLLAFHEIPTAFAQKQCNTSGEAANIQSEVRPCLEDRYKLYNSYYKHPMEILNKATKVYLRSNAEDIRSLQEIYLFGIARDVCSLQ